jgi:hypothetical protein
MRIARLSRWLMLATMVAALALSVTPDVAHADMLSGTCDSSAGYTGCTTGSIETTANLWLFTTMIMIIIIQSI